MTKMRVMAEMVISNDDPDLPTRISYPSILNPGEFEELKGVVNIWLRQLERNIDSNIIPKITLLAAKLVEVDSHTTDCRFNGCTCGSVEAYKIARANLVRELRDTKAAAQPSQKEKP